MPISIGIRGLKRNENADAWYNIHTWGEFEGGIVFRGDVPFFVPENDYLGPAVEIKGGTEIGIAIASLKPFKRDIRKYVVQL